MRLNLDCIRDILIAVEDNTGYRESLYISRHEDYIDEFPEILRGYEIKDVFYHINQCHMAGLIVFGDGWAGVEIDIADLTPLGHEFLANIRQDTNWNKVKSKLKTIGSTALGITIEVASSIASEVIRNQFS